VPRRSIAAFVKLGRPLFLGGGFVMYALGAAVAAHGGNEIDVPRYVLGQLAVTLFQLMTHYANDYFDYDADLANTTPTRWSGGSRVLANGDLPRSVALVAAVVLAVAGLAASLALDVIAPPLALPTLLLVCALAWAYSAPPLRLCAAGLGELDTAVVVTGLVPWLGYYLQAPDLRDLDTLLLAVAPLAVLQFAMLLAIELPDAAGDGATGKRTLVVRLGPTSAANLYVALTVAAYACLPLAELAGLPRTVALAAGIPAPLALWRAVSLGDHRDRTRFERLTFFAVFLLVVTAVCELVAFAM
jgi:1,4-dihydroxy-2-naphthoate octaprenyltransferase